MTKDKTTETKAIELTDLDLNEVHGGASGLPTGKRQHKPLSLATPAATQQGNPGKYDLGGDFAP